MCECRGSFLDSTVFPDDPWNENTHGLQRVIALRLQILRFKLRRTLRTFRIVRSFFMIHQERKYPWSSQRLEFEFCHIICDGPAAEPVATATDLSSYPGYSGSIMAQGVVLVSMTKW